MSSLYRNKFRSIEIVSGPSLGPTIGWVALLIFLQVMFAPYLAIRDAVPSLVAIPVVLFAVRGGARRGAILGIIAGALEDIYAGTPGAWTIATTLLALAIGRMGRGFFSDGFPMLGALVALGVLLRDLIFWTIMRIDGYPDGLGVAHLHASLYQALYTGILTVIYLVVRTRVVVDRTNVERYP